MSQWLLTKKKKKGNSIPASIVDIGNSELCTLKIHVQVVCDILVLLYAENNLHVKPKDSTQKGRFPDVHPRCPE